MQNIDIHDIIIKCEPIELFKVLKFEGLVSSGGEAKMAVSEGLVSVNGELEMRKRCKLNKGDIIKFKGESYRLIVDDQSLSKSV